MLFAMLFFFTVIKLALVVADATAVRTGRAAGAHVVVGHQDAFVAGLVQLR